MTTELAEVRRLLAAGYRLEDLRQAIAHTRTAVRPWRATDLAAGRSAFDSAVAARRGAAVRLLGLVVAVAAAVAGAIYLTRSALPREALGMVLIVLGAAAAGGWPALRGWGVLLRARLWRSRAGAVLARAAAWRLTPDGRPTAVPSATRGPDTPVARAEGG